MCSVDTALDGCTSLRTISVVQVSVNSVRVCGGAFPVQGLFVFKKSCYWRNPTLLPRLGYSWTGKGADCSKRYCIHLTTPHLHAPLTCGLRFYCHISFQYRSLTPIYYRGAAAAIVVYDITDEKSFKDMKHWVSQLQKLAPFGIVLALVGNKCDMEKERQVSIEYHN